MKAVLEMDMPRSCKKCKLRTMGNDCIVAGRHVQGYQNDRPEWCELKPKTKRLYDVRMEKWEVGAMGEVECPSDMGSEFSIYEERCNEMACSECWKQEVKPLQGDDAG